MLFKVAKGVGLLAIAAALAPFIFFFLLIMTAFGLIAGTMGPLILAFIGWMILRSAVRKEQERERETERERRSGPVIDAEPLRLDPAAYSPAAHFDLMLEAKHDIGRIRGALKAFDDATVARQFRDLADRADKVLERVLAEPERMGYARTYFASLLPKSADLAEGFILLSRQTVPDPTRRQNLIDVAHRISEAIRDVETTLSEPDLRRLDVDLRLLDADLKRATRSEPVPR